MGTVITVGRRRNNAQRCARCRLHLADCVCAHIPRLALSTRVALVMHHRETTKTTATGPLALAALTNSELYIVGQRHAPLDLRPLHSQDRRVVVLFPAEHARTLNRTFIAEDPRPITLVVPDGSWRQARRMPNRIAGLKQAPRVILPPGRLSEWGVRRESTAAGLATFEAIARALGLIESATVQQQLETLFRHMVERTLAASGRPAKSLSPPSPAAPSGPLHILFCDDSLVAINKPAGMSVHRGWDRAGEVALQRLRDQLGQHLYPIHRLDRATSGVLLFALHSEVARDVQAMFTRGDVHKQYLALCRGHDPTLTRVNHPLAKERGGSARPAVTDFRLLGQFRRYGLYQALPHTGRTHQIRRHLKHASHPIIGDVRYGKGEHNRLFRQRYGFRRLALHCQRLSFAHPRKRRQVSIQAPLSADFARLLDNLGLTERLT